MKVLQLISSGGFYGAESVLINLAYSLSELGCENIVGVFDNAHRSNTEVAEHARRLGLEVETFLCRGRMDWSAVREIRNAIRARGIDLVHTHGYKSNLYGYAAVRPLGLPILATCHNWTRQSASLRMYALVDRMVLRRFPQVVAVSEAVRDSLREAGLQAERIAIIDNGVDLQRFASGSSSFAQEIGKGTRLVVGMVGRLVPQKGPELLLQAAQELLPRFPETLFVFVGDGPARPALEQLAKERGIAEHVIFAGQRNDLPGIYAAIDIFALPSLNEGMPMTILEALAARKAIVATRVGAIPRLILPGKTGLLIEPGDAAGLRDALARLLADEQLRSELAAAGNVWVGQNFSARAMSQKYLDLYHRLVEERAAPELRKLGGAAERS
jgi:glycosyltransferase involved in cell wall biosynthesis